MEEFKNWDLLLAYIEERKVIPVVGEQLLQVPYEGQLIPLYRFLAQRLAQRLELETRRGAQAKDPNPQTLNDVVCEHLRLGGKTDDVYPHLSIILHKEVVCEPPEALLQLARIDHFNLFVSLTFDNLLARALNQVRFAGQAQASQLLYSPSGSDTLQGGHDLPDNWQQAGKPFVFQLFGQASTQPNYAVTDEDILEFVHSLQDPDRRPQRLFDELSHSHLLFLGCRYSDWLVRFFMRTSKNSPLSVRHPGIELLVDSGMQTAQNQELVTFLRHFSANTQVYSISATEFVAELSERWQQEHPPTSAKAGVQLRHASEEQPPDMKEGAVFISYASQDLPAALQLHQCLEQAGVDTWLDKEGLEPGDHWDRKIQRHIQHCALFMPLISNNTQLRREGYFRKEWYWAAERVKGIDDGEAFLLPVVIDDTPINDDLKVPPAFRVNQAARLVGGASTPKFEAQVIGLVRAWWKSQKGAA